MDMQQTQLEDIEGKSSDEVIISENADFLQKFSDINLDSEDTIKIFLASTVDHFAKKYPFEWTPTALSRSFNLMFAYRGDNFLEPKVQRDCRLATYSFGIAVTDFLYSKGVNFDIAYLYTIDQKDVSKDTVQEGVQTNFLHPKVALKFNDHDLVYIVDFLPVTFAPDPEDQNSMKTIYNYKIEKGGKLAGQVIEKYKISNDFRESIFVQDLFATFRNRFGAKVIKEHKEGKSIKITSSLTRTQVFGLAEPLRNRALTIATANNLEQRITELLDQKISEFVIKIASMYTE